MEKANRSSHLRGTEVSEWEVKKFGLLIPELPAHLPPSEPEESNTWSCFTWGDVMMLSTVICKSCCFRLSCLLFVLSC